VADAPALDARDITVRFGGLTAVDGIDLSVAPGEIVGVIGPNGAGKTTLLDAICGYTPPDTGTVHVDGTDVTRMLPYARARLGLGRSFQDARLFPSLTVRETLLGAFHPSFTSSALTEGLRLRASRREERDAHDKLRAVLDLVDVERYLDHRIAELSFGTTRAVELAWLAGRRPSVLLLDEPASGLQQSEVRALGTVIERVRQGGAVVVIDHDVPFVAGLADRLVAMDLGRVIAEGPPSDVLDHSDVVASYLGRGRYVGTGR